MKKYIFPAILMLCGCATTPPASQLSNHEGDEVETAARSGDASKVQQVLSEKSEITELDRFWLIYNAVNGQCQTDVVKTVLEKKPDAFGPYTVKPQESTFVDRLKQVGEQLGSGPTTRQNKIAPERPAAILINLAGRNACDEAFKMISEKTSPDDFASGMYQKQRDFNSSFSNAMSPSYLEDFERVALRDNETEEKGKRIIEVSKFAAQRIKADCEKFQGESCKAKNVLMKVGENMKAEAENREYAASSQGVLDEVCNSHAQMQNYLDLIKEENEKGKISGYVNKIALKQWGDRAYSAKKEFESYSAQYKAMTKKAPNVKTQCEQ
ncbi:hypothetical protein [Bdellovibrio sp. HCB-110]|uniref:hypothetical protein n=1 Tax=Bdellovibrio sp. HCB-110 TaxID=3391182 RepID=UPI0039B3D11F